MKSMMAIVLTLILALSALDVPAVAEARRRESRR